MSKITLNNVGSLIDATTAATTINNNSAVIQTAFDNTLSRDGTTPNQMGSSLDMNGNSIINLPAPAFNDSPVRLQELSTITGGGTVSNLPAGGTTGQVLAKTSSTNYLTGWESLTLSSGISGTLQAAQFPALTGNVTTTAGSLATTIPASTVTNAMHSNMNAYTIKGNATGSAAAPTDISIPALTQKSSPVAGDMIMIVDSAASNALKYATVSSVGSAGSVSSIAGNTGVFTLTKGITNSTNAIGLSLTNTTLQSTAANPTGTTSSTAVMQGLGSTCTLTPSYSGRVHLEFKGSGSNTTSGDAFYVQAMFGTGTAPANGVAATGTAVGGPIIGLAGSVNFVMPFVAGGIITGLTPGTTYWFDLSLKQASGGTASIENVTCTAFEF